MTFFTGFFSLNIWTVLGCLVAGYLLGNIQTAIIVSRAYFHDDVRNHGSGNAGSTNMVRVYGYGPGAITFTRIPFSTESSASAFENVTIAPFVDA